MKKFERYFLKIYFSNLISLLVLILSLYTFFLIIQHTEYIRDYNASFVDIVIFDLMKIPYSTYQVFPVAGGAAVVITILRLLKNSELIAYLSLGGKLKDILVKLILLNIIFVLGLIYYSDVINPKINDIRVKFKERRLKKRKVVDKISITNFYFKEGEKIYSISLVDFDKKVLYGLKIYELKNGQVIGLKKIERASYAGRKKWIFYKLESFDLRDIPKLVIKKDKVSVTDKTLSEIIKLPIDNPKDLTFKQLRKIVKVYKEKGLNADKYEFIFYNKISVPLILLVLIVILLPISINIGRSFQYIKVTAKSLMITILFWVTMSVSFSLAKNGILSPIIANFGPHLIFLLIGLMLIRKKEHSL